jgi:hypothetical protein
VRSGRVAVGGVAAISQFQHDKAAVKTSGLRSGKGAASGGPEWRLAARLAFLVEREGREGLRGGTAGSQARSAHGAHGAILAAGDAPLREVWGVRVGTRPVGDSADSTSPALPNNGRPRAGRRGLEARKVAPIGS